MKPSVKSSANAISVAARASPLSKIQLQEVLDELLLYHPEVAFIPTWIETCGDKDLQTSLRNLPQGDFFTKEIDEMQLASTVRISIHSAKDLPVPLPPGLRRVALTKGVDPRDAIVFRQGDTLESLQTGAKIATSSERRDSIIKSLRPDLECVDIRGTIQKRLEKLEMHEVDGVVIAKAALIRLQVDHLNHIVLDCPTARYQGQLAVIARSDDREMATLFECINTHKVLYTGLDSSTPFIETIPYPKETLPLHALDSTTHLIITSKMAAKYFTEAALTSYPHITKIPCISVGKTTTAHLIKYGFEMIVTAQEESSEGIVATLKQLDLCHATVFWPHSAKSRSVIADYLNKEGVRFIDCPLYDTIPKKPEPLPHLDDYDEIFFSSPSTVEAFRSFYSHLPEGKIFTCQGKVTSQIALT
ncbi:MAG: hemCD [Chlamydiia bacterium]|nr:hemCD [Chlamydiia bacterium]